MFRVVCNFLDFIDFTCLILLKLNQHIITKSKFLKRVRLLLFFPNFWSKYLNIPGHTNEMANVIPRLHHVRFVSSCFGPGHVGRSGHLVRSSHTLDPLLELLHALILQKPTIHAHILQIEDENFERAQE